MDKINSIIDLWSRLYPKFSVFLTINFSGFFCGAAVGLGVTAGAHRLWSHRAYKATLPLRILLITIFSMSGQVNTSPLKPARLCTTPVLELHVWLGERPSSPSQIFRNRRWSPQRKKRLLFLSRWLAYDEEASWGYKERKSHRLQWSLSGSCCSVSSKASLEEKNASTFNIPYDFRYFVAMKTLLCFVIPSLIPRYCWGETWYFSIAQCAVRYCISLNCTWSVNSAAHMWGNKPYDR